MVEQVNRGDKEALRELMSRCTRPMYDRALQITGDVYAAKDATRRALREMAEAARHGECPQNVEEWSLMLAQRCCDEEVYYKRLIDSMISELPLTTREMRSGCAAPEAARQAEPVDCAQPLRDYAPVHDPALEETGYPKTLTRSARTMPGANARKPVEEEASEDTDIFAPPKKKNGRALQREPVEEEADEDEAFFAPPKKRISQEKAEETPDLFVDEDVPYEEDEETYGKQKGGAGLALLIILLTFVAAGLLWVIAVKFMRLGYLGISDFGFADWFNEHLFKFY